MLDVEDVFFYHGDLGEKPHGHEETSHREHNVFGPKYGGIYLLNACKQIPKSHGLREVTLR